MTKIVGKRKPFAWDKGAEDAKKIADFFKLVIRLREGNPFIPKGVYKFKSHQEAQEWTLKTLSRKV